MSKSELENKDEINLTEIFTLVSKNKLKFYSILLISSLLAATLIFFQKGVYKFSSSLNPSRPSIFYDYIYVNKVLKDDIYEVNIEDHLVTNKSIFTKIINEFNDYEEMISALNQSKSIQKQLVGLNEFERNTQLINFAKLFVISSEIKGQENRIISFKWHNVNEGIDLLNLALNETLANVKKRLLKNNAKLIEIHKELKLNEISNLKSFY